MEGGRSLNWALFMRFLVFFLVAGFLFVLFFWVLFLKGVEVDVVLQSSAVASDGEEFLVSEYIGVDDGFEVFFDGIDVMRFEEGSSFEVLDINEVNGFYALGLDFSSGGMWISNMGGVLDVMVNSGQFMFQNVDGYYFLERMGDEIFLYAYKHPVRVHFLDDDGNSLNSYLVPEGYYVELEYGDVEYVVSSLRYAKLIKEYPFYSLSSEDIQEQWVFWAEEDNLRYKSLLSNFEVMVRQSYAPSAEESFLAEFVEVLRDWFTFSESKKEQWVEQDTLKNLNDALYYSVKGENEQALTSLVKLEDNSVVGEEYTDYLSYLNVVLNNSLYGGDLYSVKDYLRGVLYANTDDGNLVVFRERLNEMYDLVRRGDVALAKEAFSDYERDWIEFLSMSVSDLSEFRKEISEERELLSVLFLSEDGFYEDDYFELLSEFEDAVFKVAISGVDLDEERQTFVASKVKVVNKIENLLSVSGISVDDATDLLVMLLDSADVLMEEISSEAAVLSYYEDEIEEGWLITQFINSVEYESLSGTFEENFEEYLEKEQDLDELKAYLQSLHLGSDSGEDITLTEAKAIVYDALEVADVSYVAIVSVGDSSYRLFEIQGGEVSGVEFEAKYDRESELVYDLEAGGVSFTTGVHIDSLAEVLSGLSDEVEEVVDDVISEEEDSADWSYSEQLAISLLIDYLESYGILVSESNVEELDVDEDWFYLSGVEINGKVLEFSVWAGEDLVLLNFVDGEEVGEEYRIEDFAGSL